MNLKAYLEARISAALAACGAPAGSPALVGPAVREEFGDYQANGVIAAARALRTRPCDLAEKVAAALAPGEVGDISDLAEPPKVAGQGFINIRLRSDWLGRQLSAIYGDDEEGLGAEKVTGAAKQTVVVDYSGPNLAKEMHVGHLRSTIIGDALARTLGFLGHTVIRQNHVGDWGTQCGMLVAYLRRMAGKLDAFANTAAVLLSDLEEYYRRAKECFDNDPEFADEARRALVELQTGVSEETTKAWKAWKHASLVHCWAVFNRLGIRQLADNGVVRGESAYNEDLPKVVKALRKKGLLVESQGAQCVFLPDFRGKDDEPLPLIVQKSDEGYLYATTDLAAIRYRVGELKANRILYVTDSRQALHFRQVFAVARVAGFAPAGVSLEHVAFGMMLGADGKPFKTREGGTVKLMDLLDEAEKRAYSLVSEKSGELEESRRSEIARAVGIGAVKYADLAQNRASDYVFSWDKMLSLDGNTAPYMQYAYARIRSIFRKGGCDAPPSAKIAITDPAERALAMRLARFPETVAAVAAECLPNILCSYLYDLAGAFMGFYESCPVLQAAPPVRDSRLALCELTARVIRAGLGLLGIETIERM